MVDTVGSPDALRLTFGIGMARTERVCHVNNTCHRVTYHCNNLIYGIAIMRAIEPGGGGMREKRWPVVRGCPSSQLRFVFEECERTTSRNARRRSPGICIESGMA